jgi:hypothetical protein
MAQMFWDIGYDAFHLTRVATARIPGGRPIFRTIAAGHTPEDVLESHKLHPGQAQVLDPVFAVTLVTWRAAPSELKPAQDKVQQSGRGGREGAP